MTGGDVNLRREAPVAIDLRRVEPGDCAAVVNLHRAAMPPDSVAATILGAPRADKYLASLVRFPSLQQEHELWSAWRGPVLAGYAYFRELPDAGWHLNNLAVEPAAQRAGIGRALWRLWLERGRARGSERLSLDVEGENRIARDWYARRGMQAVATTWTYERSNSRAEVGPAAGCTGTVADLRLAGWENAEAWQAAFGFSRFTLARDGGSWEVGRLGDSYFRVVHPFPAVLEPLLRAIDPGRGLLVVSKAELAEPGLRAVGVSVRMSAALREVRDDR